MGQAELEAALRRDGDVKAREIWAAAESKAEHLRQKQQLQLREAEQTTAVACEVEFATLRNTRLSEAERQAQRCRLDAEAKVAERLWQLAEAQLDAMAVGGGDALFRALAAEIPDQQWQRLQVNQRDRQLAAELFPQAEIEVSDEIIGGLIVQNDGGRVQIENSLGKRLHHLWIELLPEMMGELREKAGDCGTAG